ncbi:6-pyruvoyltetrahydropterin/6-carboxytetrahydropterin synthase [Caulobacter ginsengisoli]|uniref:6-carboxy-5,6,7,8-tetrahydropterin synthase n=2 Tax=Caulobacter ginsengisoli TaxID=400775 RepID=A0ABU0IVM0_9CAUL|nr:6-pyruvoyltetrahydropterin/6-carboxytetrahydropterin synthase [Caulobacter ginsengisoli]
MAHRLLSDPSGKCLTPHGHDELVSVTLRPLQPMDFGGSNMTAAFEHAKGRWHGWIDNAVDHAFQLSLADPLLGYFREHEPDRLPRIMTFDGDPTTEALAIGFLRKLTAFLEADGLFAAEAVRVQETPTNACSLTAADLASIDWSPGAWARRADDSLNDL